MDIIDDIETAESERPGRSEPCVPATQAERNAMLLAESVRILRTIHARIGIFLSQTDRFDDIKR